MSARQIIRDIEALGVVLRFNAYKVDLTAPDKSAGTEAVRILNERGRMGGHYQAVVDLIRTRDAFAWNIPPDPCEGEACARFHRIAELRAVALSEGLVLARAWQTIIPMAEPPYTPNACAVLAYAMAAIEADLATLLEHAEQFPELDQPRARRHIDQLARHHARHGFIVRGWHGLTFPASWPGAVRQTVQSIYAMSVQDAQAVPQ